LVSAIQAQCIISKDIGKKNSLLFRRTDVDEKTKSLQKKNKNINWEELLQVRNPGSTGPEDA